MTNIAFREEARRNNVKHWEVADALGMHDSNFCRKLRKELPAHVSNQLYEYDRIICTLPATGGRSGRLYGFRYEMISSAESEQCTMIN